jgi:hypothetical protein
VDVPFSISSADEVNASEGFHGVAFGSFGSAATSGACLDGKPISRVAGVNDGDANTGSPVVLGVVPTMFLFVVPVASAGVNLD